MIILSFDPGGTTGWAATNTDTKVMLDGDFPGFENVNQLIVEHKPDIIIIETFALYPWKAKHKVWSSFPEIEVIGAIKHEAYMKGLTIVEQSPSTKQLFDDDKLKKLGLWKGRSKHARDAMRHILYYQSTGGDHYWLNKLR